MKFITQTDAINQVKKSMETAFTPEQVGHINDMLLEATNNYNTLKTTQNLCISASDIPNSEDVSLHYLTNILCSAGWKAVYKYHQQEGDWVEVTLPKID